ncbi:hypothetical protein AFLA_012338 [Aspergillus flavus NRRL3357]|nr:hypothetical protein AFLA_012338 [Aspergillus flavus NRRL3357]KAJ1707260.1 hypothetical protein NYO67_10576 [Aspergillus flavus]RAQ60694.1 hypothetical protein COH21_012720 [Aspergillus flavus]RMZ39685.1 hypothetical protein CA14_010136 [Aspergillus flavus]
MVLNGIGLSPLVMAALGLLQEANHSIKRSLHWALGPRGVMGTHILLITGVALAAASKNNLATLKTGVIIFLLGWTILAALTILSHRMAQDRLSDEKKLLLGMTAAVPIIGVRVIYTVASVFTHSRVDGGSLPVRVILGMLPEFLAILLYISAGIMTRGLASVRCRTSIRGELM